jgi:hypothetical protein
MRLKADLRYELKYLINRAQHQAIVQELAGYMGLDTHGDEQGVYPITSLYYDTPTYQAYWDKLEGHRNRRKIRVRVYGNTTVTPETRCFLEIKQRLNTRMRKRRAVLTYAEAVAFDDFDERAGSWPEADAAVLREVAYLYRTLQLRPACIVRYDRMAFEGNEHYPDLRVTFDTNLRCRTYDLSLLSTGYAANEFFLSPELAVLEVKANQNVPYWLTQMLSRHRCVIHRISKYCAALEHSRAITSRQRFVVPVAPVSPG